MLVLDDVGTSDTTVTSSEKVVGYSTPNLQRLALTEGVLLSNYYTQTVCSPTRSALMTGRWPFTTGMQHVTTVMPGSQAHVPLSTPTIAEMLKQRGYINHAIGKWHLGYAAVEYTPTGRGFETYLGYMQGQCDYYNKSVAGKLMPGLDFWDVSRTHNPDYRKIAKDSLGKYSLDLYEARFEAIVDKYNKSYHTANQRVAHPLFIYYAHQSVHIPLEARVDESSRCKKAGKARGVYCSMMVELDDAIGRMEATIKKYGLWDDMLIVATTDNGGMVPWTITDASKFPVAGPDVPFPGSVGSNHPRRGTKTSLYEGGVRCLAFISGGAVHPDHRGTTNSQLHHAVDLAALVVRAATGNRLQRVGDGIAVPGVALNGDDAVGFDSAPHVREDVPINIIHGGKQYTAIRFGPFKLIVGGATPAPGILTAEGWYPADCASAPELPQSVGPRYQLFNLDVDPNERVNLASTNKTMVKEGMRRLQRYLSLPDYTEPQHNAPSLRALPLLHGGAWAPFLRQGHDDDLYAYADESAVVA